MANTFTSIFIHIVFAVKNRDSLIPTPWLPRVWSYMKAGINAHGHETIAIGGTSDHVHILIRYKITELIPDLVKELKINTSKFISTQRVTPYRFSWQSGYGCFSYGKSQIDTVKAYIQNQAMHHKGITLRQEIRNYLDKCGIEYDERFLFEDI